MVMLKVAVLVALVAGVSALHPSMRLLSDGMRHTVEVCSVEGRDTSIRASVRSRV